ncbi:MAG: DUF368 domain-containing protein [Eubacteriales bacterium]|nr:DUF368 domain-containing protein [Eubacteriales bacterium]
MLCVVFGIYRPLMEFMAHPLRELKKNFWFFLPILFGFAVGVLGISKLLQWVLNEAETPAIWLFVGLIAGTLPSLWQESGKEGRTKGNLIIGGITFALMLAFLLLVKSTGMVQPQPSIWLWLLCGVMWGLGIIAPGLSPSSLFFFMGVMEPMMDGISKLSMSVIIPMGLGLILCVLSLSRGIGWLLKNRYAGTMHAILGLALASTIAILPLGNTASAMDVVVYVLCFGAGVAVALWMDRMNQKLKMNGLKT